MSKIRWRTINIVPAVLLALAIQGSAAAQTIGMVVNRSTGSVTVFDAKDEALTERIEADLETLRARRQPSDGEGPEDEENPEHHQ